jgi:hypothetical protein
MSGLIRSWGLGVALLSLCAAAGASAQENLEAGKTPAQLYASDCAICHKSPRGLSKAGGLFGLDGFLRQHYTSSHESAAAITAYLQAIDREPEPAHAHGKRAAKGEHKAKLALPPAKPSAGKTEGKSEVKTGAQPQAKPEAKSDSKSGAKPDTKSATKSDSKSGTKSDTKSAAGPEKKPESKADAAKADAGKSNKDSKPEKSD